jgi:hypothetical protein
VAVGADSAADKPEKTASFADGVDCYNEYRMRCYNSPGKTSRPEGALVAAKKRTNPFYVFLVFVGILFTITACAYCVMAIKKSDPAQAAAAGSAAFSLVDFLSRYGLHVLVGELALLGLATFAAIGTDGYWEGRGADPASSRD